MSARRAAPPAALLLALAVVVLAVRPSAADEETPVEAQTRAAIEEILAEPDLPSAIWGIYVRDLEAGRTIYSHNSDKNLIPASNLKLFTTATALDALGPDFRYVTRLYLDGSAEGDVLRGDLVLRGSGDPTFGSRNAGGEDPFATWARELAESGVRRVEGRLIGDDDVFDDNPYAEGWDVWHVATEDYAPGSGGLAYADNLVELNLSGSSVRTDPAGYVEVRSRVQARRGGGYSPFSVSRDLGSNTIYLNGSVSSRYRGTLLVPIENPTRFALHAFAEALRDEGIRVDATLADVDDLEDAPDYEGDEPLFTHVSPPLSEIVRRINQRSDNFWAEQVFRTLSEDGSTAGGTRRVLAFLESAGVDTEGLSIRDGSGLSRKDLVTPASMVGLLDRMNRHPARGAFYASLAQPGGDGTLGNRLSGVPVRGKTGSLEYVRALSGYVTGPNGHRYAFCVIANNYTTNGGAIASAQDRIVRALATGQRVPAED
jgi:D-alanyl-D-alanine carboxypeptidase/D-alanyl-D-alanine-endopeptidase (penicillin-binding protein 4)